jgi:hypothetical protein
VAAASQTCHLADATVVACPKDTKAIPCALLAQVSTVQEVYQDQPLRVRMLRGRSRSCRSAELEKADGKSLVLLFGLSPISSREHENQYTRLTFQEKRVVSDSEEEYLQSLRMSWSRTLRDLSGPGRFLSMCMYNCTKSSVPRLPGLVRQPPPGNTDRHGGVV